MESLWENLNYSKCLEPGNYTVNLSLYSYYQIKVSACQLALLYYRHSFKNFGKNFHILKKSLKCGTSYPTFLWNLRNCIYQRHIGLQVSLVSLYQQVIVMLKLLQVSKKNIVKIFQELSYCEIHSTASDKLLMLNPFYGTITEILNLTTEI